VNRNAQAVRRTPLLARIIMAASAKTKISRPAQAKAGASADAAEPLPLHPGARLTGRVALAIVLLAAALWTAADFLPPLIWAVILAIAIWPFYLSVANRLSGASSSLSALLVTLSVGLLLFLPVALAAYQLAQHSNSLVTWIGEARDNGIKVPEWVARLPIAADSVREWWTQNLSEPRSSAAWLQSLRIESASDLLKNLGGQLVNRAFMFFFALIALFVLLRDGHAVARRVLLTADRIFGDPGEGLAEKMVAAIRGTVNGTIIVAVGEGLLIGAAYVLAGVPSAMIFTILTIAFAMLPFGAWAAFTLAAVTLVLSGGEMWIAFAVFAWGAVVMLTGDHFVWPVLVGGAARLPFLFAFVGIFGGLASFGLLGLFLGPVVMAALLTIWREWVVAAP
jgi:predicted PurR-regulated permease PerM